LIGNNRNRGRVFARTNHQKIMKGAMHRLHDAPDDFGGHKAQAEADLKQAWISLRKALYFRLYEERH
jgi:hypothetical protein